MKVRSCSKSKRLGSAKLLEQLKEPLPALKSSLPLFMFLFVNCLLWPFLRRCHRRSRFHHRTSTSWGCSDRWCSGTGTPHRSRSHSQSHLEGKTMIINVMRNIKKMSYLLVNRLTFPFYKENIHWKCRQKLPEKSPQSLSESQRKDWGIQRPLLHWYSSSLDK